MGKKWRCFMVALDVFNVALWTTFFVLPGDTALDASALAVWTGLLGLDVYLLSTTDEE